MEKERTISIVSTVGMFLLLEVLAFVSFGLSNSYIVYAFVGVFVAIILFVAHFSLLRKEGLSSIIIFLIPLLLFGFITALNAFNSSTNTSMLIRVLTPFGFLAFSALGYLSAFNKFFKISTALTLIYGGLALYVIICLVATMIQFVPFYTIIYKNYYIYYNGARTSSSIGSMAYILNGFSIHEVSLGYFSLFPSVLSTSVIALLFISPKKETKKFVLYALFGFIGLITLLFTPTRMTLITDFLIAIVLIFIVLFGKNKINGKIFSKVVLVLSILFILLFLILFLNAQTGWGFTAGLRNAIVNVGILNKLFNNSIVARYNVLLNGCLSFNRWLGFMPSLEYSSALHEDYLSKSIIFDTLLFSGLFGLVIFIIILVFIIRNYLKYYKNSSDSILDKSLIAAIVIVFYGYSFLNYDSQPFIFYSTFTPFYLNGLFLVTLFLYGYVYKKAHEKVEEPKEEVVEVTNNEEQQA